ncbi:MAG TPA: hypothetical protein P5330_01840 [Candidatus Competibacteraceae bacterium]|nr:hypothetical protein [Candidatus Competibacteraceae bacterium]
MAKFKMKKLALALGVVAGGMGLVPAAQAVNLATDGLGQSLIFPYYTTRAGWNTLFNITNTSDEVVAIKVRFHEGFNSRDVFDFNVILSPHDVWNGTLSNGVGDVPTFSTLDTTCTVPAIPSGGVSFNDVVNTNGLLAYTGTARDTTVVNLQTTDRMREGYVTVIMMGSSPPVGLAFGAVHTTARVPGNCAALRNAFALQGTSIAQLRAAFPNYNLNPLKGAFSLVNAANGWNASGSATTLANFYVPAVAGDNLITAQLPPSFVGGVYTDSFHEPELSSANTAGEVLRATGGPVSTSTATGGADAVSFVLQRSSVINQWANRVASAATGGWSVASDWVVTFPTKRFYADTATHEWAGRATGRAGLPAGLSPFTNAFALTSGQSCDTVRFTFYDREEQTPASSGNPVFSPAPTPQGDALCEEVNVLSFGATGTATNVLGSPLPTPAERRLAANVPTPTSYENGWMQLNFTNTASWLPTVGFAVINRTDPVGTLNESYTVDNAYIRP